MHFHELTYRQYEILNLFQVLDQCPKQCSEDQLAKDWDSCSSTRCHNSEEYCDKML
jgi:hypothetical protein